MIKKIEFYSPKAMKMSKNYCP